MLRLCSLALALMASPLVAAPAPVWKERLTPKTPFEVMLGGLLKTGGATGPYSPHGTWTLIAEKTGEERLEKVAVTVLVGDGTTIRFTAKTARLQAKASDPRILVASLEEGTHDMPGSPGNFTSCKIFLELFAKP